MCVRVCVCVCVRRWRCVRAGCSSGESKPGQRALCAGMQARTPPLRECVCVCVCVCVHVERWSGAGSPSCWLCGSGRSRPLAEVAELEGEERGRDGWHQHMTKPGARQLSAQPHTDTCAPVHRSSSSGFSSLSQRRRGSPPCTAALLCWKCLESACRRALQSPLPLRYVAARHDGPTHAHTRNCVAPTAAAAAAAAAARPLVRATQKPTHARRCAAPRHITHLFTPRVCVCETVHSPP